MFNDKPPLNRTGDKAYEARVRRVQERSAKLVLAEARPDYIQAANLKLLEDAAKVVINPDNGKAVEQWQVQQDTVAQLENGYLAQLEANLNREDG
jgi:hypothetical protein